MLTIQSKTCDFVVVTLCQALYLRQRFMANPADSCTLPPISWLCLVRGPLEPLARERALPGTVTGHDVLFQPRLETTVGGRHWSVRLRRHRPIGQQYRPIRSGPTWSGLPCGRVGFGRASRRKARRPVGVRLVSGLVSCDEVCRAAAVSQPDLIMAADWPGSNEVN